MIQIKKSVIMVSKSYDPLVENSIEKLFQSDQVVILH